MYIFKRWSIFFNGREQILEFKKRYIQEFIAFIRPKICLFITGIAVSGYLLFNPVGIKLIFVFLCAFFGAVAAYTYNQLTDRKEDLINKEKLNSFVISANAPMYVISFVLLSFIFALFLSKLAVLFYVIGLVTGMGYSSFRIKEIFLLKNLYTAFIMPMPFLLGATANSLITYKTVGCFLLVVLLVFVVSLLGDLRDCKGDKATGINTMSVVFGYGPVKKIASLSLGFFILTIVGLGYTIFYLLMPFIVAALLFLKKDDLKNTRICILSSFMFLPFVLFIAKIGGF